MIKTPIEHWKDGPRLVTIIADMLNMKNYFIFSRVDRHEITFRIEENPENKTAADVARAINDHRFRNNFVRRSGVMIIQAVVGDKTKEPMPTAMSSNRGFAENGPNVMHALIYMVAGAVYLLL